MYIDHQTLTSQNDQLSILCVSAALGITLAGSCYWIRRTGERLFLSVNSAIIALGLVMIFVPVAILVGVSDEYQTTAKAIVSNLQVKYDTVGEIELAPKATWERSTIVVLELADGQRIVGGTVVLDDSGEPRIVGAVYGDGDDKIPLRK